MGAGYGGLRGSPSLRRMCAAPLADRPLTDPHPDRLSPFHRMYAQIVAAHAAALDAGEDGYSDPESGLFVLTAAFLADRGTCCEKGCRHCPYVA